MSCLFSYASDQFPSMANLRSLKSSDLPHQNLEADISPFKVRHQQVTHSTKATLVCYLSHERSNFASIPLVRRTNPQKKTGWYYHVHRANSISDCRMVPGWSKPHSSLLFTCACNATTSGHATPSLTKPGGRAIATRPQRLDFLGVRYGN